MGAIKGWKTILVFGLSALSYVLAWDQLSSVIDPKWIATATAAVGFVLRFMTNTSVFKKE